MVKLDFEYYLAKDGTDHRDLFEQQIHDKCPQYLANLDEIFNKGIEITREEFYTYGLFEDYNPLNPYFNSYRAFRESAEPKINDIDRYFSFNNTVKFLYRGNPNPQICYAGCAGTLVTANKIFGLNNTNYIRIPEKKGRPKKGTDKGKNKTLDFEYLHSDGERFFRVECKGVEGLDSKIGSKARDIIAKKKAQPAGDRDLNFGIITQIPVGNDIRNAKCTLVDPPTEDLDFSPKDFLFYTKIRFYATRLSNLGNTGWLVRIKDYITTEDKNQDVENYPYFNINNSIPQKMMFRSFFDVDKIYPWPYFKITDIFRINDIKVFARLIKLKDGNYLLYGFTRNLLETMNRGTIEDFIKFKEKPRDFFWKDILSNRYFDKDLFLSGNISILSTGEVIGILNRFE